MRTLEDWSRRIGVTAPAALLVTAVVLAQGGEPLLHITSPDGSRALSGLETLSAELSPRAPVTSMEFYIDGARVCVRDEAPFTCSWKDGDEGLEHVVRVVAILASGRRLVRRIHTPEHTTDRPTLFAFTDAVLVPVVVRDRFGEYVSNLPVGAFRVLEDGIEQTVSFFEPPPSTALDIAVAIDISRSIADKMPALKRAVRGMLASFEGSERVSLLAFNERFFVLSRQVPRTPRLGTLIDQLEPSGYTSLYDTIARALKVLDSERARKALLLFTDGEDSSSLLSVESVQRRIEQHDVPVYVVTIGNQFALRRVNKIVKRLAAVSGGQVFSVRRLDRLQVVLAEIREELRQEYLLGYTPKNAARDGSLRRITVQIPGRPYQLRAREAYRLGP